MSCRIAALLIASACAFAGGQAEAKTYEVGPGRAYEAVGAVPWESLSAGDEVRIHHRPEPYREKWVIGGKGTVAAPILVRGVPGPGGELPIIDGDEAVTRGSLPLFTEDRGVVTVRGPGGADSAPTHIVIESLHVRGGRQGNPYSDRDGMPRTYAHDAAGIFVEEGRHVTIRGCRVSASSNGLLIMRFAEDVLVERNHFTGNGYPGSIYVHNSYAGARRITYQENRYDPLCAGCGGNNLKDRSAGAVIRYNWIEGGNRQLDLVDSSRWQGVPEYRETFVYGNVLIERAGDGNRQIIHYGGDSGDTSRYRKGTLYFHHNTVVSRRTDATTLMRLSTNDERAEVANNILLVTGPGQRLEISNGAGHLRLARNWVKAGWVASHGGLVGSVTEVAPQIDGELGLIDLDGGDLRLTASSTARDAAAPLELPAAAHPPVREYRGAPLGDEVGPPRGRDRFEDGAPDVGAFEYCEEGRPGQGEEPGSGPDAGVSLPGDGGLPSGEETDEEGAGIEGGAGGCGCGLGGSLPLLLTAPLLLVPGLRRGAGRGARR